MSGRKIGLIFAVLLIAILTANLAYCQDDDSTRNVLKQGLLGAGTGAIASGASGGKAGQGALIGAGTGILGSILLDAITKPSTPRYQQTAPPQQAVYYPTGQQGGYAPAGQGEDYYYEEPPPPQESSTQKVLKQGLLGAGTGAIASGASGGNAGTGALIGAGTGAIGGALLDAITAPSSSSSSRPRTVSYTHLTLPTILRV